MHLGLPVHVSETVKPTPARRSPRRSPAPVEREAVRPAGAPSPMAAQSSPCSSDPVLAAGLTGDGPLHVPAPRSTRSRARSSRCPVCSTNARTCAARRVPAVRCMARGVYIVVDGRGHANMEYSRRRGLSCPRRLRSAVGRVPRRSAMPSGASRDEPVFYAPSIDYYVVTRYRDIEAIFLNPQDYSAAAAQLPLVQLVPEALEILARGRPQAAALDGQPRPAGPHAPAPPGGARVHAAARRGDAGRASRRPSTSCSTRSMTARRSISSPTLTFPLPATIVFSFMGVPEADWPQLKEWCGSRASLGWGRPAARRAGRSRDATWPRTAATCASS